MNKCLWIAGWACHFTPDFQEQVKEMSPQMEHHFLPAHQTSELQALLDEMKPSHIVAWSLGAKKLPKLYLNSKLLFIAPAFDFCHEKLGVKQRVITKMQAALKTNKSSVLTDFLTNAGIKGAQQQYCLSQLEDVSIDQLHLGLEELLKANPIYELSQLSEFDVTTVVGTKDNILNHQILVALNKEAQFTKLEIIEDLDHNAESYLLDDIYESWLQS